MASPAWDVCADAPDANDSVANDSVANRSVAISKLDFLTWSMVLSDVGYCRRVAGTTLLDDVRARFIHQPVRRACPLPPRNRGRPLPAPPFHTSPLPRPHS